jgi:hypothetical protein
MKKNLQAAFIMRTVFLVAALFILTAVPFAQVKFSASTNDKTIGRNDYLQVEFTVENANNVESISPPSFKNFAVVSGPNHQSSMSNINGNIRQSLSIGYVLKPLSTGNFTIGAATAKADGREFRSSPLSIQVTNSSSSSGNTGSALTPFGNITLDFPTEPATHQFDDYILQKDENVAAKIKKNLFIKIELSKKSCYTGEPVIATYKLYTRLKSESNVTKAPSFNGFSVSELEVPDNFTLKTEKYNGREYNVYILRKVQLYPLQSGNLSLEPVEVKNRITFLKSEYAGRRGGDVFYDMLRDFANENAPGDATEQHIITVTCDTSHLIVKPLPEEGRPQSFKGAVGNFNLTASVEKNSFTTDDAGSLKLVISGGGNIELINAPNILWPQGLEGFEAKTSQNIDKFSVPMKGDKVFVYPFTVAKEGDYTIPAVSFSYFDIATQAYKTVNSQPIAIHVTKGTGIQKNYNTVVNNKTPERNWYDYIYAYRFYLAGGLLLLSVLLLLFMRNRRKNTNAASDINDHVTIEEKPEPAEFIIPANPLADAEQLMAEGNINQFYKVLDTSFHNYLSQKLEVPIEELTRKKINSRMDKCNVGVGTTLLVNSLLEDIEINLYAPVSSESKMQEVYEKASEVVSLLDKQIC